MPMETISVIIAILSFGLGCFKIGYIIGKDVARREKSRPTPTKNKRL
jgi:hypothetical protein